MNIEAHFEAQMIVEAYGIIWNGANAGDYNTNWATNNPDAVEQWYSDLDHSTTYYEGGDSSTHWSHFAFEMFYGHIAFTSAQVHLMFNPAQWNAWLEQYRIDHPLANIPERPELTVGDAWVDPASWNPDVWPSTLPEMSYFSSQLLAQMNVITLTRYLSYLTDRNDLMALLQYLYSIEWLQRFS